MSLVKPKSDTINTRSESNLQTKDIYLFDDNKRRQEEEYFMRTNG